MNGFVKRFIFVRINYNDLSNKQPKGSYATSSHTHDDRYYTEGEINNLLVKIKTKRYTINIDGYDGNINKYKGVLGINNDRPSGTVLTTIITDNAADGYDTLAAEWAINPNGYLICNDVKNGNRMATVTWIYI